MGDGSTEADQAVGSWRRPPLPPEGRADFLEDHPFDIVRAPLPDDVLVEQVMIPMRDGIRLAASVFRPADGAVVPVIAACTPYGKDNYDQWDYFRDPPRGNLPGGGFYLGRVEVSDHTAFEAPDPGFWVPNGYAVVLVDHPGLGRSESNPAAGIGIQQRFSDVLVWLEDQPWCTGAVAMSGVSALCAVQWVVAMDPAPPQLKAIVPWEGINETGAAGGAGGIPELAFPQWVLHTWILPNVNPDAKGPEPTLRDWHYDTSQIGVPALVCASFSDQELHTWDTFDAFSRMRSEHKYLYNHRRQKWGAYYGPAELAVQRAFLDRFLKDDATSMDGMPTVRLEVNERRDVYKVVTASAWPLPGTVYETWHLDAGPGRLTTGPPDAAASVEIAPRLVDDTGNRAVFDHTFDADTDLIGHMVVTLALEAIDTTDVDLFVGVEKLDTSGNEVYFYSASGGNANGPVTRGWLRASKRALDPTRSTAWRPVLDLATDNPLTPGEVVEVTIPLMPSATTFRRGETLRLVIQSWSTPGQWEGGVIHRWDTNQAGAARLHTGPDHPATLVVPTVR